MFVIPKDFPRKNTSKIQKIFDTIAKVSVCFSINAVNVKMEDFDEVTLVSGISTNKYIILRNTRWWPTTNNSILLTTEKIKHK